MQQKTLSERQQKNVERRQKQREANIPRAQKMHLARIAYEDEIKTNPESVPAINTSKRIIIGCSGWFYWDWRETFYPAELLTSQWFDYYAKHFKTVELNAAFSLHFP